MCEFDLLSVTVASTYLLSLLDLELCTMSVIQLFISSDGCFVVLNLCFLNNNATSCHDLSVSAMQARRIK